MEIDDEGHPRALEILNASKIFNTSEENLKNIRKIEMTIAVSENNIQIKVILTLSNDKTPVNLSQSLSNILNIPNSDESIEISYNVISNMIMFQF